MHTEVTTALMNEVVDMRNCVTALIKELIPGVELHHRAIAVSPFLLELHIDFETEDRAVWICFNQDKKMLVHRHRKDIYDRHLFRVSFEEIDANWIRTILAG